jgi:hypothetical protein
MEFRLMKENNGLKLWIKRARLPGITIPGFALRISRRCNAMNRGIRIALMLFGIVSVYLQTSAFAQTKAPMPERLGSVSSLLNDSSRTFYPLEVGNEWVYNDGANSFRVQVLRETVEANNMRYFEISGYFPEDSVGLRKIRQGPYGQILEYNPNGEDFLWYRFGTFNSVMQFQTNGNISCITNSLVISGGIRETVVVPAGTFDKTMRIDFQAPCADAGIATENFAPGVGLVQRTMESFMGPRSYKLAYARVGSQEYPKAAYGVQVAIDQPVYYNDLMPGITKPWPTAKAMLAIQNTTLTPVTFTFPTSQQFEFIVRDALGKEVLRWSDGFAFAQVVTQKTLVHDSWRYPVQITLKGRDGKVLAPGFYTLTGYLAVQNLGSSAPSMSGTVAFEIQNVY